MSALTYTLRRPRPGAIAKRYDALQGELRVGQIVENLTGNGYSIFLGNDQIWAGDVKLPDLDEALVIAKQIMEAASAKRMAAMAGRGHGAT